MSVNDDNPFAQMVLPPRTTLPKKPSKKAKEQGEVRRRIESIQDRLEWEREWGELDD